MHYVLYWFRNDLRLADNPALTAAVEHVKTTQRAASREMKIIPIYIFDEAETDQSDVNTYEKALQLPAEACAERASSTLHSSDRDRPTESIEMGSASRVWLHHSLEKLNTSLGEHLHVYRGNTFRILSELVTRYCIKDIFASRDYEPSKLTLDSAIKHAMSQQGCRVHLYRSSLLWEPESIVKDDCTPYRVFTPFYRKGCLQGDAPRKPLPTPWVTSSEKRVLLTRVETSQVNQLNLLPQRTYQASPPWHEKITRYWQIGEEAAMERLQAFLARGIDGYKEGRDFPAASNVSRLSPHLHFGEISPNQIWHALERMSSSSPTDVDHYRSELGWREFSYNLLYHNPQLPRSNLYSKFDAFPWRDDPATLRSWQRGETGVPIVDAGMRQLWQRGYMHNRVRMIVGSFLVKNLLIHWVHGMRWFWDCLVDADLASNSASWQWIAGCGADAAPYFRIFNPITQGSKFDPQGIYIREYIPALKNLPIKYLYAPWEAPDSILEAAGIKLGIDYPHPIVDLKESRARALEAFQSIKPPQTHRVSEQAMQPMLF